MGSRYYDPKTGRFINTDDVSNLGVNGDFASLNLYTCAVGAIGNFTTDAFKGDIHSVADAGRSMASGSLANGLGFVVSKAVAITKVCKVDQMPRTARKAFLRDEVFHNSQAMVNQNLRSFRNYSFFKRVAKIENSSPILKSGIYSSLTSTIALMLR